MDEKTTPTTPVEPLFTPADIARLFSVEVQTLNKWIKAGKFPEPIRVYGARRWVADTVRTWIADMQRAPVAK